MKDISNTWKIKYMNLAKEIASWSKDPSTKVGCIAVGNEGQVLSQGYNGFPRNIEDKAERYNNKQEKYKYVVHAEMNCIYHACLNGISLNNASLFVYGLVICHECAKGIIQVGISNVYGNDNSSSNWHESHNLTKKLFKEAGVIYETI
jgi:dCMP deaminase